MLERLKRFLYRSMTNNEIDYETAEKMMAKNPETVLVDVRSKQEYGEGHLPGSVSLCLYDLDNQAQKVLPNKMQNIIVYCSSANSSKDAQEILETMGYKNVYNLKGGLDGINLY